MLTCLKTWQISSIEAQASLLVLFGIFHASHEKKNSKANEGSVVEDVSTNEEEESK